MLITVGNLVMRVDVRGIVRYARCIISNLFVKHAVAQALYDAQYVVCKAVDVIPYKVITCFTIFVILCSVLLGVNVLALVATAALYLQTQFTL